MKVEIITPGELGLEEVRNWARIQAGNAELASPFLSPQFAAVCARVRARTRIAVFTSDDGVTGYFPFESGRMGLGKALGLGFTDIQGVIAPATADLDIRALLTACGLRLWEFDHLLAWQGHWLAGAPHRWVIETSPVIDVGFGWAAYEREQRKVRAPSCSRRLGSVASWNGNTALCRWSSMSRTMRFWSRC